MDKGFICQKLNKIKNVEENLSFLSFIVSLHLVSWFSKGARRNRFGALSSDSPVVLRMYIPLPILMLREGKGKLTFTFVLCYICVERRRQGRSFYNQVLVALYPRELFVFLECSGENSPSLILL